MTLTFGLLTWKWLVTHHPVERTRQDVPYFSSFIAKSWLNGLDAIGQVQRSLCTTQPLMWSFVPNIERIHPELNMQWSRHDKMRHILAVLFAKSWLNDLEDISQCQGSLCATHPRMLVIICAQYGKNPSRSVGVTDERTGTNIPLSSTTSLCGGMITTRFFLHVSLRPNG